MQTGRANLKTIEPDDAMPAFAPPEAAAALSEQATQREQRAREAERRAGAAILQLLSVLSQRTIVAAASLVDFALIGSVFVLWLLIIENPSQLQLLGAGMYALFVMSALYVRRRK